MQVGTCSLSQHLGVAGATAPCSMVPSSNSPAEILEPQVAEFLHLPLSCGWVRESFGHSSFASLVIFLSEEQQLPSTQGLGRLGMFIECFFFLTNTNCSFLQPEALTVLNLCCCLSADGPSQAAPLHYLPPSIAPLPAHPCSKSLYVMNCLALHQITRMEG